MSVHLKCIVYLQVDYIYLKVLAGFYVVGKKIFLECAIFEGNREIAILEKIQRNLLKKQKYTNVLYNFSLFVTKESVRASQKFTIKKKFFVCISFFAQIAILLIFMNIRNQDFHGANEFTSAFLCSISFNPQNSKRQIGRAFMAQRYQLTFSRRHSK